MITTIIALAAIALLVAADQITKLLISSHYELGESTHIIPGLLDFTYVQNRGAAFGMLANQRWVFLLLTTVIIIGVVWLWFRGFVDHITARISAVLIVAGGIGNIDVAILVHIAAHSGNGHILFAVNPHVAEQVAVFDIVDAVGFAGGDVHLIERRVIFAVGLPVLVGKGVPVAIVIKSQSAVVVAHPVHLVRVILAEAGGLALHLGHVARVHAVVIHDEASLEVKLIEM